MTPDDADEQERLDPPAQGSLERQQNASTRSGGGVPEPPVAPISAPGCAMLLFLIGLVLLLFVGAICGPGFQQPPMH